MKRLVAMAPLVALLGCSAPATRFTVEVDSRDTYTCKRLNLENPDDSSTWMSWHGGIADPVLVKVLPSLDGRAPHIRLKDGRVLSLVAGNDAPGCEPLKLKNNRR